MYALGLGIHFVRKNVAGDQYLKEILIMIPTKLRLFVILENLGYPENEKKIIKNFWE